MRLKTPPARKQLPLPLKLRIELWPVESIQPYVRNAKEHSPVQIRAIARSIDKFGFVSPILIDDTGELIAGHGRLEAAKLLGMPRVPAVRLGHMSEAQRRAYRVADNRLAEKGSSWSMELLCSELDNLSLEADFDVSLTGFDSVELDAMQDAAASKAITTDPPIPALEVAAVSRLGDTWTVGEHRLICGDATVEETYRQLLKNERPAMVFGDAPYNVKIAGNVSTGKRHREFVQASGEMSDEAFRRFLLAFMTLCARYSVPGSLHYYCMDWKHLHPLLSAGMIAFTEQVNLCVWAKTNAGLGSLYRSQHELIGVFRNGKAHRNNVQLGKAGRHRSNLWTYAGMNTFAAGRDEALASHPTVKPLAMVRDAIMDSTGRGELILDPFGGSGTTLLAAHEAGRVARLIELDPLYCDVIIRRCEKALGVKAVLVETGEAFDEAGARRSARNE